MKMLGESSFIFKEKYKQEFPFWKKKMSPESWSAEWDKKLLEGKRVCASFNSMQSHSDYTVALESESVRPAGALDSNAVLQCLTWTHFSSSGKIQRNCMKLKITTCMCMHVQLGQILAPKIQRDQKPNCHF